MKRKSFFYVLFLFVLSLIFIACDNSEKLKKGPELVSDDEITISIDIYDKMYHQITLSSYINNNDYENLDYELTSDDSSITLSQVSEDATVVIYSTGKIGNFNIDVDVKDGTKTLLTFFINVNVVDSSPDPKLINEIDDIEIDAPVFNNGKTRVEKTLNLEDYFEITTSTTFMVEVKDETIEATITDNKLNIVFTDFGLFEIKLSALKNNVKIVSSTFTVELKESYPNQLINGGFEDGWTGWNVDSWAKAVYTIHDSEFDIWGNNVGATGSYLYGFYNEEGTAEFFSSLFTASGTGFITWKMAGNSTEDLQFKLMKYNKEGEDELVDTFNNWYFGKYGSSGFIFRSYYYQIDMDKYNGAKMYFAVVDNKTEDFGFICLDDIITYYENIPDTTFMYKAGYIIDPEGSELDWSDTSNLPFTDLVEVGYQLPNGDFENGYDNWYMTTENKKAYAIYDLAVDIWSNPVNATRNYLYGYQIESATAVFHSNLFKVGGNGLVTWKMAGNSTNDLKFILMKYNENEQDEEIATFNNWYFPISEESGFIFRNYWYLIDLDLYQDSYMYFVVSDYKSSDFGFICLDDIVTYYEEMPTFEGTWFKAGFVNQPEDWDVLPGNQNDNNDKFQLCNGDFEKGWEGWIVDEEIKESYTIINSETDIWDNPVNNNGYYLYGYENESAKVTFESARFIISGTGLITWKMAGNSTDDLKFILMKENIEGDDEVIATFNNWYFPISEQSGFIFWNYFYQVNMEKYKDATLYFIVSDQKDSNFGFICLDDIVTYYEEMPTFEGTWFKAGFVNQPEDWDVLPSNQ
ncbi:MAG: hypothetical protein PHT03_08390 [Bacilli bacterium]|nr:hypothetical protein [Bacilli bacterium]